jgi:branched-chain amino acid transport system ATP-binding protein
MDREPESSGQLLEAESPHTYYGTSHILHGVDFAVAPGETIGLLGRNGMGKTTLLRSLLGLTRPHLIARAGIAYVPEGRGIFANLSVRENLVMAARRGSDGRRAWDLDRVLARLSGSPMAAASSPAASSRC